MKNRVYRVAITLWVLFAVTFLATVLLVVSKRTGIFQPLNPYLYLVGPLSLFIGVGALLATSRGGRYTAAWNDPSKRAFLQLVNAFLNGFAFWFLVMGMAFLVGLVRRIDLRSPRLIADAGAALIFLYGWAHIRKFKFKLLGAPGLVVFFSNLIGSLVRFLGW